MFIIKNIKCHNMFKMKVNFMSAATFIVSVFNFTVDSIELLNFFKFNSHQVDNQSKSRVSLNIIATCPILDKFTKPSSFVSNYQRLCQLN